MPSTQQKRTPKNQQGCQVGKWFVANLWKYQRLYGGDTMHRHTNVCKSSQLYGTISFRSLWTYHLQTLVKLPKALSPAAVSMDIRLYCCLSKVKKPWGGGEINVMFSSAPINTCQTYVQVTVNTHGHKIYLFVCRQLLRVVLYVTQIQLMAENLSKFFWAFRKDPFIVKSLLL